MGKRMISVKVIITFLIIVGSNELTGLRTNTTSVQDNPEMLESEYDVIVIGGEPEGVAAAVSAARNNAKTLLIERRPDLGGLFTYGMLNYLDIPQGADGQSVSRGIFTEWHQLVGGKSAFGILEGKQAFHKLISEEENLTFLPNTEVVEAVVKNNRVNAVKVRHPFGEDVFEGKAFIDATQDADFAAMAGAPYFIGAEDLGLTNKKMSATIMIHLQNVDWNKIKQTANSGKFGTAEVTNYAAWGFPQIATAYKPQDKQMRLRGLNIAKVNDEYFINALQIFQLDELDEQSKQIALERGKQETNYVLDFLKAEFPGFEAAEIKSYPAELYVRESRHVLSEYQLPLSDVWTNKDHWDGIGFGAYPVDVQAQVPNGKDMIFCNPKKYAIPFRSLVPLRIDGLLVVGRAAGYSSLAAGSARVVPTGMTVGEAAGAAASLAVQINTSFRNISNSKQLIDQLRECLTEQGAYVDHYEATYPYQGEWYDEAIQILMNDGLIQGNYNNELHVESKSDRHAFFQILSDGLARSTPKKTRQHSEQFLELTNVVLAEPNGPITRDEAAKHIVKLLFGEVGTNGAWDMLKKHGVIDSQLADKLRTNRELVNKEMFALNAAVIRYLVTQ